MRRLRTELAAVYLLMTAWHCAAAKAKRRFEQHDAGLEGSLPPPEIREAVRHQEEGGAEEQKRDHHVEGADLATVGLALLLVRVETMRRTRWLQGTAIAWCQLPGPRVSQAERARFFCNTAAKRSGKMGSTSILASSASTTTMRSTGKKVCLQRRHPKRCMDEISFQQSNPNLRRTPPNHSQATEVWRNRIPASTLSRNPMSITAECRIASFERQCKLLAMSLSELIFAGCDRGRCRNQSSATASAAKGSTVARLSRKMRLL